MIPLSFAHFEIASTAAAWAVPTTLIQDKKVVRANTPSVELHQEVRSAFVKKGTSLNKWCEENNIDPRHARQAMYGVWNGPKGQALREKVLLASGITEIAA